MLNVTTGHTTVSLPAHSRASLVQNLFAAGFYHGHPLCAGVGTCGRCRIRYLTDPPTPDSREQEILSPTQIDQAWRLGCRHYPRTDVSIEVPDAVGPRPLDRSVAPDGLALLAVDVGTTAVKWQGMASGGDAPVSGRLLNPQVGAGADVMARMAFAQIDPAFAHALHRSLVDVIHALTASSQDVSSLRLVVTGNSVMIHSFLGLPMQGLATSPYVLDYLGNTTEAIPASDSEAEVQAYIPPLFAPFVGADIACGLCHLILHHVDPDTFPFLLADFGTNGEFVLALAPDRYLVTSVAMGPALEGVGLTRGTMAGPRVCTGFTMGPDGVVPISGQVVNGVSGTGYLSLVSLLKRLGVLDVSGRFVRSSHPMARTLEGLFVNGPSGTVFTMNKRPVLTGRDVEEILKLKASCNYAIEALLDQGGVSQGELRRVFVAGSLGTHVRPLELVDLGFVPRVWEKKIVMVGNTALGGAWDLLTTSHARETIEGLSTHVRNVDLPGQQDFTARYVSRMRFEYC